MKRIKKLLKVIAASVLAMNVLVSCTDDDQTQKSSSGQLGKISIERTDIGAYQPFTLECPVSQGKNMIDEKIYWESPEIVILDKPEIKDGKSYLHLRGFKAGKHTLTCNLRAIGMDGQDYLLTEEIQVDVKATDIRNNYWGESKEETRRNLQYYSSFYEKEGVFYISESDIYGSELNFSSEITGLQAGMTSIEANRTVIYNFSEGGKLNMITYACTPKESDKDMIAGMAKRQRYIESYNGFAGPVYGYQIAEGQSLTEEETDLAEKFKAGELKTDVDGTLQQAVADKKLIIYVNLSGEKSQLQLSLELSQGGNVLIYQVFTPKST